VQVGKEVQFCHFRRERQSPINFFDLEKQALRQLAQGYCSYPKLAGDECSPGVSGTHTIQRRGGLTAIAEAGHVLGVKASFKAMIEHEGKPPPRRVGVGQASVFPGFCNKHDTATFRPIEGKSVALDRTAAFLFSYRAIAYERFAKEAQLKNLAIQKDADRGLTLPQQELIQRKLDALEWGVKLGMQDVDGWKADYDARLLSGDLDRFYFHAVKFDRVLPVVACGAFHPDFDLRGEVLQRLARRPFEFEHLALCITAYTDQTVAFFGWIGNSDGPAATFVNSFETLPNDRKADALVRIAFEQMENIYLKQTWWDHLPQADQTALMQRVWSGTPDCPRKPECLVDRGTGYAFASVVQAGP
jgi:hypothetical protein